MNLCTAGKHGIVSTRPKYKANYRMPVHYEKQIEEEIQKKTHG